VSFWKKRAPILLFLGLFLLGILLFLFFSRPRGGPETGLIPASVLSNLDQEKAKAQKDHEHFRKTPAGKIWERHPYWDRLTCQKIAEGQVWPQMSKEMAGVAVGPPKKVTTEKRGETLYEEWIVEGKEEIVLRFEDNTLIDVERR
jgi:hypothetical protein